jgi:kynureninase
MVEDGFWAAATARAGALDAADPLAGFRERFHLAEGLVYLDGNSLGPAPKAAIALAGEVAAKEWAEGLIGSWNAAGWWDAPLRCGDLIARVIGAEAGEVIACDTVSINIFKCLHAALAMRPDRSVIVAEAGSFPTDIYVAEGVAAGKPGVGLRLEGRDGDRLEALIGSDVAAVLVNHVDYRTGEVRDVAAVTARAHDAGALVIWDLCHSAGVMPVEASAGGADMAVGCTYKYLNGGPGAPGFVFAARRHHAAIRQPLSGWWGHARPFAFAPGYEPDPGIRKFLCGTQPMLSFRAMEPGLTLAAEADLSLVRAKSVGLTSLFVELVEAACGGVGVGLLGPREAARRGSQVALTHDEGYAVVQALIARGVVGDFRMPDIMRFGFAPLYVRYRDVVQAAQGLHEVLAGRLWDDARYRARAAVT